jgi:hypothetical protein
MNDLGVTLVWAAVQVTLVTAAAAVIYLFVARHGARAGALVAAVSLGSTVALTLLAFCPLPSCWAWQPVPAASAHAGPDGPAPPSRPSASAPGTIPPPRRAAPAAPPGAAGNGLSWPLPLLRQLWEGLGRARVSPAGGAWSWPGGVAVLVLAGAGLGLLRLALGLWGVRVCFRRSRPVADAALLRLVETLRTAMGCRRPVTVRECPDLAGAATAGWLRPVLLLPPDWRGWGEAERRAVLAHELAHVCGSDYLAGFVARLSTALHFYHPLVYWLSGRLHLQHELAADALGAHFAGGRTSYLRALAQLALRQEARTPAWPARMFLPAPGTLLRRIQMLRARNRTPERPAPPVRRALTVALLLGSAVAVSALRGPARGAEGEPPAAGRFFAGGFQTLHDSRDSELRRTAGREPAPFDLSYAPRDGAQGVVAFRPAAFYSRPGMKPYARRKNREIAAILQKLAGPRATLGLPVEAIEQVTAGAYLIPTKDGHQDTAFMLRCIMVRATRPFDWKNQLQTLAPKLTEVSCAGKVYYKASVKKLAFLGPEVCYFIPDDRTIVFDSSEKSLRRLLRGGRQAPPAFARTPAWKRVERGLLAVGMDNRDKSWGKNLKHDKKGRDILPFVRNINTVVFGLDFGEKCVLETFLTCPTEQGARTVARLTRDLLKQGRAALAVASSKPPAAREKAPVQFVTDLVQHGRVRRQGKEVHLALQARGNLADLMAAVWMN